MALRGSEAQGGARRSLPARGGAAPAEASRCGVPEGGVCLRPPRAGARRLPAPWGR